MRNALDSRNGAALTIGASTGVTMSSREIAELTGKRHDHVMRDMRSMLVQIYGDQNVEAGIPNRDTFEAFCVKMGWGLHSPDLGNGRVAGVKVIRDRRGFVGEIHLDYNHTMTLIAGYNAKLRKAIIDKWQALEEQGAEAVAPSRFRAKIDVARETRLTMSLNLRMAKMAGLAGNQALLSANRATVAMTGVDALGLMGIAALPAPQNEALLSPTEIGQRIGRSAREVNLLLCDLGLQVSFRDLKGHLSYEPTDEGRAAGGVMQDTGKSHGNGTPVRQLRWASSIVNRLKSEVEAA